MVNTIDVVPGGKVLRGGQPSVTLTVLNSDGEDLSSPVLSPLRPLGMLMKHVFQNEI